MNPHFPYDQALQTAINSFNGNIMPTLFFIAKAILTVSLLWSLYDAWVKGGDVRSLGISLLKYAAVSIVVLHWNSVFTDIVNCFDSVSYQIYQSAGISDLWTTYTQNLQQAWNNQNVGSIWTIIRGSFSALIAMLGVLAGYVLWPIAAVIFVVFYTFWGCVLYGVGSTRDCNHAQHHALALSCALHRERVRVELLGAVGDPIHIDARCSPHRKHSERLRPAKHRRLFREHRSVALSQHYQRRDVDWHHRDPVLRQVDSDGRVLPGWRDVPNDSVYRARGTESIRGSLRRWIADRWRLVRAGESAAGAAALFRALVDRLHLRLHGEDEEQQCIRSGDEVRGCSLREERRNHRQFRSASPTASGTNMTAHCGLTRIGRWCWPVR